MASARSIAGSVRLAVSSGSGSRWPGQAQCLLCVPCYGMLNLSIQWSLVVGRPGRSVGYGKTLLWQVVLLVPALYIFLNFYPDVMRNWCDGVIFVVPQTSLWWSSTVLNEWECWVEHEVCTLNGVFLLHGAWPVLRALLRARMSAARLASSCSCCWGCGLAVLWFPRWLHGLFVVWFYIYIFFFFYIYLFL